MRDISANVLFSPPQRGREDQELRARLRVMETRREEDAARIRELEGRLAEAENFVAIRPKLQGNQYCFALEIIFLILYSETYGHAVGFDQHPSSTFGC